MKTFRKYNSIENAYQRKFIEAIQIAGFAKDTYVVQEKVHGANFSFWTDGEIVQYAKRTSFLTDDDNFYNYQGIAEKYQSHTLEIFSQLKSQYPDIETVTIFGELFGGHYPHPEVERNKQATLIQKGVYYTPDNEFYAFDIRLDNERYLPVAEASAIFETVGFFYAKTLFKGSLSEALKYNNAFNSLIPSWLGLPPLENNICEGVIIRPKIPRFFHSGSRVIIKNKNEKWTERNKNRKKEVKPPPQLSEKATELQQFLAEHITENRLINVISKIGAVTIKDFGKVMGLFVQDILADFNKEYEIGFNVLEKAEQKIIKKFLSRAASQVVREHLLQKTYDF